MPKYEGWHRRHAVQLDAQLPDDPNDARMILELVQQLVDGFLSGEGPHSAPVLAFSAPASRSLDSSEKLRPSSRPK